jgi:hypothetical protein
MIAMIKSENDTVYEDNIIIRNEPAIICDLDGTLALKHEDRTWYDASTCDKDIINMPVLEICSAFAKTHHIVFCSGRENKYREQTLIFLKKCFHDFIEGHDFSLFMRETQDNRKDSIVKHEIYMNSIKDRYDVLFVLDDRTQVVQMWRNSIGLTCLQVAEGNF